MEYLSFYRKLLLAFEEKGVGSYEIKLKIY